MKHSTALAAFAALVLTGSSVGSASAAGFSDTICPEATQYMLNVGKLRGDAPPQAIYDTTQAAVDAYARCSKEKLANGYREATNYANTRGAGLAVVAARALVALNRIDDAQRELQQYRPLAQQVVDWQSETQLSSNAHAQAASGEAAGSKGGETGAVGGEGMARGSDHRGSMYKTSAKEIVAAIDAELAQIAQRSRDTSRPQAQQPAPATTPSH